MFFYAFYIHNEIPCEITSFPMYLQAFQQNYFLFAISILLGGGTRVAFKVFTEERGIGKT